MKENLDNIKKKLNKYNQEHLLLKYNELDNEGKKKLIDQINNIDFELMEELYTKAKSGVTFENVEIEPVEVTVESRINKNDSKKYINLGIKSIQNGEYAVVTMAGGQGTRLGHPGPKGSYMLLDNNKSLFELLCDNLKRAARKYNTYINWYIMTSEQNNAETIEFFEKNNYFDYPKNYIKFFIQGKLPMIGENGHILLEENGLIKEASDGHGGTLSTLAKTGILAEMKKKNIKWVYISGVDNVLANLVDPQMIGLSIENDTKITVKSVIKSDPREKAGVLCRKNGRVGVIEYTEVTKEMAYMRDNFGEYVYGDLNVLLHVFSIDALEEICEKRLPYHTAHKKADYLNANGVYIKGETPNAYKFESFIFDAFEMLDDIMVLRVKREDEFAPLKNAKGADSPATARKLYYDSELKRNSIEEYDKWLKDPDMDKDTKTELEKISGNIDEIKDRFYKELEFGTAGLRGIMGAGTNRMNKYTVTKATQGLANYIKELKEESRGVVICYDTRNNSKEFAQLTALTLNANGIKTYIFDQERPVPVLSYSVRLLNCIAGIMITASHNPPEYNGYKVYWENGAQIIPPIDKNIIEHVKNIKSYSEINNITLESAKASKLYMEVGNAIEERYLKELEKSKIYDSEIAKEKKELRAVYSPLHGTGNLVIKRLLDKLGYENIYVVPEQELPNGYFPTVAYPNPEDPKALEMSVKLANEIDAEVCFATDPDSDRFGMMVRNTKGEFVALSGNQVAVLMLEYILSSKKEKGEILENSTVISTIVSTNLTRQICNYYGVEFQETLTGFKYMGNMIDTYEKAKNTKKKEAKNFIFGFEESYGYLYGTHARDKDGVVASMMALEMIAYYNSKNISLLEQLENIYKKYGYYIEGAKTITIKGESGQRQIASILEGIRKNIPSEINGVKVTKIRDYKIGEYKDLVTNTSGKLELPQSNVVYLEFENDMFIAARPSGTEPKLKFYIGVNSKSKKKSNELLDGFKEFVESLSKNEETAQSKISFRERK